MKMKIPRSEWLAAIAAILCYFPILFNDFCDDGRPIALNNDKINLPGQWKTIWTTDYWSMTKDEWPNRDLLYRPVALSSYRLVRQTFGASPVPQHLVNLILHALISVLVARFCRSLGGSANAAMIAGVVFAVLPIHSEVLCNVVGRGDLLASLGILLTLLLHRKSLLSPSFGRTVFLRIAAAIAAFLAMGAKENGLGVLAIVPLFDLFWTRSAASEAPRGLNTVARLVRHTAYLIFPVILYLVLRYYALEGSLHQRPALTKTVNVLVDAPMWQRMLGIIQLWGMYWWKTIWPSVLSVNYSINEVRLATGIMDFHVIVGVLIAGLLGVFAVKAWTRGLPQPALLFACILFTYAPTANALVLIQIFFAERIWYVPSLWIPILLALAISIGRKKVEPSVQKPMHRLWTWIVPLVVLVMIARCWIRIPEWRHNGTLYASAYRDHPKAVGCMFLYGQWLAARGEYEQGIELLNRALTVDLGYTDVHRALGRAYRDIGDRDAALRHLQIAGMQAPGHPPTEALLEEVSHEVSENAAAELERLQQDTAARPDDPTAETAYVRKLRELGRLDEAIERLKLGEPRFSNDVAWNTEYAVTLVFLNKRDEAIDRYRRCVQLASDDPNLAVELAMLLLERRSGRDLDEAWELANRAGRLAPHAPFVLVCQAELTALRGDPATAVALLRRAIQVLPPESPQRELLEQRAKTLGEN